MKGYNGNIRNRLKKAEETVNKGNGEPIIIFIKHALLKAGVTKEQEDRCLELMLQRQKLKTINILIALNCVHCDITETECELRAKMTEEQADRNNHGGDIARH